MALTDILQNKVQIAGFGIPIIVIGGLAAYFLLRRKKKSRVVNFSFN